MAVLLIAPLDKRPVCYSFLQQLSAFSGVTIDLPPQAILGQLKQPADRTALLQWIQQTTPHSEQAIVSTDLLSSGGLIPTRVQTDSLSVLQANIDTCLTALGSMPCHGVQSILRIPNYNHAEEEPDYWEDYGAVLYQASESLHRQYGDDLTYASLASPDSIPSKIWADWLGRRQRFYALNCWLARHPRFESLVFAQDDTGTYGFNVWEAQQLVRLTEADTSRWVQTGADEVQHCLMAKLALETSGVESPSVWCHYTHPATSMSAAKFDGQPIQTVAEQRIHACGARFASSLDEADLVWLIHTPTDMMGDHCEQKGSKWSTTDQSDPILLHTLIELQTLNKPTVLADVAYANGADPVVMAPFLDRPGVLRQLTGYAAWNTPGNTLGCSLAMGVLHWYATRQGVFSQSAFDKALLTRLVDDWIYQSLVRQQLRGIYSDGLPSTSELTRLLYEQGAQQLLDAFNYSKSFNAHWPCQRTFEVSIDWANDQDG